jgi:hypothetical protein
MGEENIMNLNQKLQKREENVKPNMNVFLVQLHLLFMPLFEPVVPKLDLEPSPQWQMMPSLGWNVVCLSLK